VKVLIVDGNPFFRILLREKLRFRFPSFVISEAEDGEGALQQVLTFPFDLIFMDIQLPDKNGLELTRLIKRLKPNIDVRVVVLTSYDQSEYRDAAINCEADHYVSKHALIGIISSESPLAQ
jgi:DNA-binding NarL/FixJ family response regulator